MATIPYNYPPKWGWRNFAAGPPLLDRLGIGDPDEVCGRALVLPNGQIGREMHRTPGVGSFLPYFVRKVFWPILNVISRAASYPMKRSMVYLVSVRVKKAAQG